MILAADKSIQALRRHSFIVESSSSNRTQLNAASILHKPIQENSAPATQDFQPLKTKTPSASHGTNVFGTILRVVKILCSIIMVYAAK